LKMRPYKMVAKIWPYEYVKTLTYKNCSVLWFLDAYVC